MLTISRRPGRYKSFFFAALPFILPFMQFKITQALNFSDIILSVLLFILSVRGRINSLLLTALCFSLPLSELFALNYGNPTPLSFLKVFVLNLFILFVSSYFLRLRSVRFSSEPRTTNFLFFYIFILASWYLLLKQFGVSPYNPSQLADWNTRPFFDSTIAATFAITLSSISASLADLRKYLHLILLLLTNFVCIALCVFSSSRFPLIIFPIILLSKLISQFSKSAFRLLIPARPLLIAITSILLILLAFNSQDLIVSRVQLFVGTQLGDAKMNLLGSLLSSPSSMISIITNDPSWIVRDQNFSALFANFNLQTLLIGHVDYER